MKERGLWSGSVDMDHPVPPIMLSRGVHFELVYDEIQGNVLEKYIKLVGFTTWATQSGQATVTKDVIFCIANDNNQIVTDGTRIIKPNNNYWYEGYESGLTTDEKYQLRGCYYMGDDFAEMYGQYYRMGTEKNPWVGKIIADEEGNIEKIDFADPFIFMPASQSLQNVRWGYIQTTEEYSQLYESMTLEMYAADGWFDAMEYPYTFGSTTYGSGYSVHNPLRITTTEDGYIGIANIGNRGVARVSHRSETNAECLATESLIKGKFDADGNFVLVGNQDVDVAYNNNAPGLHLGWYEERLAILTNLPNRAHQFNDVVGTVTQQGNIEHRTPDNMWVLPGDCRTYVTDAKVSMPAFAGVYYEYNGGSAIFHSTPAWGGGTLSINEMDVTLNADITGAKTGRDDERLFPQVTFEVRANDTYIDSYTLFMIPLSKIGELDTKHENFNHANGHAFGYEVVTVKASAVSGDYPKVYGLQRLFNKADMPDEYSDDADKYVYYVRANYRDNIQLAPERSRAAARASLGSTFHGLYADAEFTGANDIIADDVTAPVRYFNLQGIEVTEPAAGNVYIRLQGNKADKIFKK